MNNISKGVAEDTGKALNLLGTDSVPYQGAHTGLVVTEDVNPLDPTASIEHKVLRPRYRSAVSGARDR